MKLPMKNRKSVASRLFLLFAVSFVFIACTPTKKLTYVMNEGTEASKNEYFNDRSEKTIQPYDYLYIKIFSLDERTNSIFSERSVGTYETPS